MKPAHGSQKQTFLYVRSVKDSVLKLDSVSTRLAFNYENVGVLRRFALKTTIRVVFELQNVRIAHVVGLQIDFHASNEDKIAPFWGKSA
jgi:hypothetical protein